MMKISAVILRTLLLIALCEQTTAQTDTAAWSSPGGLPVKAHKTINQSEFARQYSLNKTYWDEAFHFLRNQDLNTLPAGKYTIDGDQVFAFVTQNPTKDYDSTQWESHREYTDLHYVIEGEEIIGISPVTGLTITKPYDATKDLINYSGTGEKYPALPGTFFIFFPSDGHRPGISPGGHKADKKIVIKVRYKAN